MTGLLLASRWSTLKGIHTPHDATRSDDKYDVYMPRPVKGDWTGLSSSSQRPRYEAILRHIFSHCKPDASVLDIGCGEGVLAKYLRNARGDSGRYLGVETSREAVAAAQKFNECVVHMEAEDFSSADRWDCIVLSEMLYYCKDPTSLLQTFKTFLATDGVIIITIYHRLDKPKLLHRLFRFIEPRRPRTNRECSEMIDYFLQFTGWRILLRHDVKAPADDTFWRLWLVRPPSSDESQIWS